MGNIFDRGEFWRGEIGNVKFHRMRLKLINEENVEYQNGYPNRVYDPEKNDNYLFYTNQIQSRPEERERHVCVPGNYIDVIHKEWWGDYVTLEKHHGYIQWLFPTRERGHNVASQLLQQHEAEKIMADPNAMERVLKSYNMMLDFYGLKLIHFKRGTLEKAANWEDRIAFLDGSDYRSIHNYLRITRILRSLGDLGYENLKHGLVNFLFEEIVINRTLPNAIESLYDYWIPSLRDPVQRDVFYQRFATMVKHYPEMYEKPPRNAKK